MESDYEKQLRESNEHLRKKLAEALAIRDEKKNVLDEKVKMYGKTKEMVEWETSEAT